ncbi:DNA mismatch repair protein PMS1 isoform X1 [Nymphaea colorata]|nr:DNA mismatch repair protein PMS1 isoform X1 [Nymphaea colorata]
MEAGGGGARAGGGGARAGGSSSPAAGVIRPINKGDVHRICSGQVILDLPSAVKELVENSLDAGSTSIDIALNEYGRESFKVADNGCGIPPHNFQGLALKHHTTKIADFSDLQSLSSFGFRGEALSSLCALGNLSVETRTRNEEVGTHLIFDHSGLITSETKMARQVGTTVTVEKLFSPLPVRCKEFSRNVRREFAKLISLLHAYALIAKGVRLVCTNKVGKNPKYVALKTQGSTSLRDNIIMVFGMKMFACLEPLDLHLSDNIHIEGFLSKPGSGRGRTLGDRQFFYVNGRPVDLPKASKLINEFYKSLNSKQYPIAIMNFILPTKEYDINVTPDKRKIFFSDEGSVMLALREAVERIYSPSNCSYSINTFQLTDVPETQGADEDSLSLSYPVRREESENQDDTSLLANQILVETLDDILDQKHVKSQDEEERAVDLSEKNVNLANSSPVLWSPNQAGDVEDKTMKVKDTPCLSTNLNDYKIPSRKLLPHSVNNRNSLPGQKISQSKLTKFVTVNRNDREESCTLLSEEPILRNSLMACNMKKCGSYVKPYETLARSSLVRASASHSDELKEEEDICHGAHKSEAPEIIRCMVLDKESQQEHLTSEQFMGSDIGLQDFPNSCDENMVESTAQAAQLLRSSSGVVVQSPKRIKLSNEMPDRYPTLHFDFNELRSRREQRLSILCPSNYVNRNGTLGRCYSAATIESSCLHEDEEAKARALWAATRELERSFRKESFAKMKVIGQFNLGFIIGRLDQDLFIIDQHAADEKYNFERLSKTTIMNQQPLLQPLKLELSPEEEVVVSLNMEIFRKNGFILKEDENAPPGCHFLLTAVPFSKNITFGAADVKELVSALADTQGDCSILSTYKMDTLDSICPSRVRSMFASRACRSSVMIGDPLRKNEMQKLKLVVHAEMKMHAKRKPPVGKMLHFLEEANVTENQ